MKINKSKFDELYDLASSRKGNPDDLRDKIESYPDDTKVIEKLYADLNAGKTGGYLAWIKNAAIGSGILFVVLIIGIGLYFKFSSGTPLIPGPTSPVSIPTPTNTPVTPTEDLPATQAAIALSATPTVNPVPTSAQVVVVWEDLQVPICFDSTTNCIVWQLAATPDPLPVPTEALFIQPPYGSKVTSIWEMIDSGFHLNGMVAVYLKDYSPYDIGKATSKGELSYFVNLDEMLIQPPHQIEITDREKKNMWIPLGLYLVNAGQKLSVNASMTDGNYLPIGPLLVVRFSDTDQQKLEKLRNLINNDQIVALLDEDSRFLEEKDTNWESKKDEIGFGGDIIEIDETIHKTITWKLAAGLEPGNYDIFIYMPLEGTTPTNAIKCENTDFFDSSIDGSQWYQSKASIVVKNDENSFEFTCDWAKEPGGKPVYLDVIAIVKRP